MRVFEGYELSVCVAIGNCDVALCGTLECRLRLHFAAHISRRVGLLLLLKRVRLDDLLDHLP